MYPARNVPHQIERQSIVGTTFSPLTAYGNGFQSEMSPECALYIAEKVSKISENHVHMLYIYGIDVVVTWPSEE